MSIAFFDFDRTLIDCNSAWLWLKYEYDAGRMGYQKILRNSWAICRYSFGSQDLEETILGLLHDMRGESDRVFRERCLDFYTRCLRSRYRPGIDKILCSHRQNGDRLVMLTSATSHVAEPAAQDLQLDDVLCSRLEVDPQGLLTGKPTHLSYGSGKLALASQYAHQWSVSLQDCFFYTDSNSDLPVLQAIGRPIVVHPDWKLRRVAQRAGWPIVYWGDAA